MAYIHADIKIPEAGINLPVKLFFPIDYPTNENGKIEKVITLLHGMNGGESDWGHMTAAYRYAADKNFALVMPAVGNSFYHNMVYGPPFYDIIAEYLPAQLNKIFKLPTEREKNYIAGLSMGGYGALRIALSHPERYAAAASFSGALDISGMMQNKDLIQGIGNIIKPILGENFAVPNEANLFYLAKEVSKLPKENQPRIFCTCGKQDFIYSLNTSFREGIQGLPLNFTYREWDGIHDWKFWDRSLAEFIGFATETSYGEDKKAFWNLAEEEFSNKDC